MKNLKKFKAQTITKNQAMDIKGGLPLADYCKTNRMIAKHNPEVRELADIYYRMHCSF